MLYGITAGIGNFHCFENLNSFLDNSYLHIYVFHSGKCVCGSCATHKARITRIDEYKLFKVCCTCVRELNAQRKYRVDVFEDVTETTTTGPIVAIRNNDGAPQEEQTDAGLV